MSHQQLRVPDGARRRAGLRQSLRIHALLQELEIDDDEVAGLYGELEEKGIELTDDCGLPDSTKRGTRTRTSPR